MTVYSGKNSEYENLIQPRVDRKDIVDSVSELIRYAGEDPSREGLLKTPARYVKAFEEFTSGYKQNAKDIINDAIFEVPEVSDSEMVIVRNIELYSLCEHHLVPFFGQAHVAYLPKGKVLGLSKIARLTDMFARRLQVQERLTAQIAHCLMEELNPYGVGVVIEANHMCMMMRGVEKQNSSTKTSKLLGDFKKNETRAEFFNLIRD